jgi:hypothetical protein
MPWAAPISTVSPAARPPRISTLSVVASCSPNVTVTFSVRPLRSRTTNGAAPRWSTAVNGSTTPSRLSLATRPSANRPPTSAAPSFGMLA